MTTSVTNQKSDATTTVYAPTDPAAVSSALLPTGFIEEPEDSDPDEIETVRMPLMIAGEEPDAELLARAEPIAARRMYMCAGAVVHSRNANWHEQGGRGTIPQRK